MIYGLALFLVGAAGAAPFNTSGYNGSPGSLAGFDGFGNPTEIDPGPVIRDEVDDILDEEVAQADNRVATECEEVLDEQFEGRSESERDGVGFTEDVEQICIDVLNEYGPDLVETELAAQLPGAVAGYAGTYVEGVCDDRIELLVPALVAEYGECECEEEIDAALDLALDSVPGIVDALRPGLPSFAFGVDDHTRRVSWSSVGGGSQTSQAVLLSAMSLVPFVEETNGRSYSGIETFVQSGVSGTVFLALYDLQSGVPSALLWSGSAGLSTLTSGPKALDFSADGSVTTAGTPYFDAISGDLALETGDVVVLAVQASANTTFRTFNAASVRPIGWTLNGVGSSLAPFSGWKSTNTAGSWPGTVSTPSGIQPGSIPVLWLDPA